MQFNTITKQKLPFFVALGLMAMLTSCGSFQYAGYDNDGIYTTDDNNVEVERTVVSTSTDDSNYYKNYFAENSAELDAITEEGEIFTDIDSYQGNYTEIDQDTLEQRPAYGGWGQNNSTVTINVIDNGWYGWNDPWLWNGGFGVASWGWGRPWGWNRWGFGWNNWGWNAGWGWNNPWAWNAGWGYGWNNWGWGPGWNNWGWNNGFYRNSNRYAYNSGRRGSVLYNNDLSRLRRSNAAVNRRDYSTRRLSNATRNSNTTRVRSNNSSTRVRSNSNTRVTRPTRTTRNSSSTRVRSNSGNNTRVTRPTRSTRSSGSVRSTRSTRSSSGSRVRSSGGSRSSSGSRSSGGGRRGRG